MSGDIIRQLGDTFFNYFIFLIRNIHINLNLHNYINKINSSYKLANVACSLQRKYRNFFLTSNKEK